MSTRPPSVILSFTGKSILPWLSILLTVAAVQSSTIPIELKLWLETEQDWRRDTDSPIVALGESEEFDDTHIFAPAVARLGKETLLWYSGSSGTVIERVFRLGLARSKDGIRFSKEPRSVFDYRDGKHSVLTPSILRKADGSAMLENGKLRMWFTSTWFQDPSGLHTLHESFSSDGMNWSPPSAPLLKNVYAPTVLKIGRIYQMWYTDVSSVPWIIRHAWSMDGHKWRTTPKPSIVIDQDWETQNLFYPHVIFANGVYHMWYGSYWTAGGARQPKTALGYAVSIDGMRWFKHAENPVFKPAESRPWESHYVTSHGVTFDQQSGSMRMYYASRKKPPFRNKYYAINTAVWNGVPTSRDSQSGTTHPDPQRHTQAFKEWQNQTRAELRAGLGIPKTRVPLDPEPRGSLTHDGIAIEKWVITLEKDSKTPALLYRPADPEPGKMPAIVLTYGHGGSKSAWQYHYAAQLYAKLGLACLAIDPLGEEERNLKGRMGSRAHDPIGVHERALKANRMIMGKLVFDTMRGVDFLLSRDDIDPDRIGVAGNSLGGAKAGWMAALDPRLRLALVCGWSFENIGLRTKYCTKAPNQFLRDRITWADMLALAAPQCSVLIMNGDADWVIDREDDKSGWRGNDLAVAAAKSTYSAFNQSSTVESWFEPDGGHRPYFANSKAVAWIHQHLGTPNFTATELQKLPNLNAGKYCDTNRIQLERLYGTELHQRGATLVELDIRPLPREQLAVLTKEERGIPEFTVEGWLKIIRP
jgi:dienelactone hydrolase